MDTNKMSEEPQWLKEIIHAKRKVDRLSILLPYLENQIEKWRKKSEEAPLEGHEESYYQAIKVNHERDKKIYEVNQEKYQTAMEKYIKDDILTEEMMKDLVKRSIVIRSIQSEINSLGDTKYELEEEQKEKIDQIQEKYNHMYLSSHPLH